MKKSIPLFCATAIAVTAASPAYAQVGQTTQADDDRSGQLEEIIVTAQKRSENLQIVPVAVSSVKAETLEAAGIHSLIDVQFTVPSLNSFNANGYATSNIRGVGSVGNGPGVEYPIAIYVDGVYLAAPLAATLQLNNIEAVDVLKGPQGTLFGRNATGGLIQVTTRTPDSTARGKIEVGYANYGTVSGSAYLSGPLASNLRADISVQARGQSKGWGKNIFTGNDAYRVESELSVRSKWILEAGPDTKFTLIGDYSRAIDSLGTFTHIPGTVAPELSGNIPPFPIASDRGYNANNGKDARQKVEAGGVSLRLDQGLGDIRFSSITAYRKSRFTMDNEYDFSPANTQHYSFIQPDRQFTQELQLSSDNSAAKFKWTVGAYYFNSRSGYQPEYFYIFAPLNIYAVVNATTTANSLAGYGQASYEIFDSTNITAGVRYTSERRRLLDTQNTTYNLNIFVPALPPVFTTVVPDQKADFRKVTFRFGLDHRFSDQVFGYVSFNRGFKSGGYNLLTPADPAYNPEVLDAYEAGLKTDLLDKRLRVNVAGFYYDYSGLQIQRIAANGGFNVLNGASAHLYGAEADITAIFSRNFNLTAGATWLHPNFTTFLNCPTGVAGGGVPTFSGVCNGKQLPIAAKFVTTIGLHYSADVGGGTLNVDTNGYYNSGYYFEPDNIIKQNRHVLLGASLKWQSDQGYWITAFGKNLTNRRIYNYAATLGTGGQVTEWAEPRTYGVAIGYEF